MEGKLPHVYEELAVLDPELVASLVHLLDSGGLDHRSLMLIVSEGVRRPAPLLSGSH
jgi:hypothetical protein